MLKPAQQPSIPPVVCRFQVSLNPVIRLIMVWTLIILILGEAVISSSDPIQCSSERSQTFNGKVAVIDRGVCAFADKVCTAQLQGAIAAIVINNVDGSSFTMGGSSRCVTFL